MGLQHTELRTLRCPWSIDKFFKLIFTYLPEPRAEDAMADSYLVQKFLVI